MLASLLVEGLSPRAKKRAPSKEAQHYGAALAPEVTTLLEVAERFPIEAQSWSELRPLFFREPYGLPGKDAAEAHLTRAPELGWPVYFEAHFWNAFPIGATPGGDYWLAQLEGSSSPGRAVFLYDHETVLARSASSLSSLVARERGGKRSAAEKASKSDPRFDPAALYRRSGWLTSWLVGRWPDDVETEMRAAPAMTAFSAELGLLGAAPHLALYWLFAHAVLRNTSALDAAIAATATSKHAFVGSARALCKRLIADDTLAIGALTRRHRRKIAEAVEALAPDALLEPVRRRERKAEAGREKARVTKKTSGQPPEAMLAAHPDDLRVQLAALAAIATADRALAPAVAILTKFARAGGSPGSSKWQHRCCVPPKQGAPWLSALLSCSLMRLAVVLLLGVSCAAARADNQAPASIAGRHEPCDPASTVEVRHRTEGAFVHVEMVRARMDCEGPGAEDTTLLARIALPAAGSSCPIGQLALRMWDDGRNVAKTLPAFVSTLRRESLAEVSDTLAKFGERGSAFVVECPGSGRADWLLVETSPRGSMPRVELFIDDRISPARQHPRVSFSGSARGSPAP